MQPESERIEQHIENKREDLGRNLEELESRVKNSLDWRTYYNRNPWLFLGATLAGSALITAMASKRGAMPTQGSSAFSKAWDNVQGALMAVAAKQMQGFIEDIVPGIGSELRARM